ncbi:MAG TPA: thioredoxin domain-containing protein [Pyrinomonadaceae bacterium]|nr:thioredoxin domain-containing protein [Pyrinomonadaceae bacterium]
MKKLVLFPLLIAISLVYFSPAPTSATSASNSATSLPPSNKDKWLEGADGYERAVQLQKELNVPLVVYFWAGWCPYCQALDSKYLPTKPVQEYLREVVKVRIYPEEGPAERALAKQYNVRGYPSFFIIRNSSARPVKVHPFRNSKNLTPEQFAEACRDAGK